MLSVTMLLSNQVYERKEHLRKAEEQIKMYKANLATLRNEVEYLSQALKRRDEAQQQPFGGVYQKVCLICFLVKDITFPQCIVYLYFITSMSLNKVQ